MLSNLRLSDPLWPTSSEHLLQGYLRVNTTSISLLDRLRQPDPGQAWNRFVELYTPFLYHCARQLGLQESDAADLVQEVFGLLLKKLPTFTYERNGSFRAWLRKVTLNKWRELKRRRTVPVLDAQAALAELPSPENFDALWEAEYQRRLVNRVLELIKAEFQPPTWKAFWECMVNDRPAAEVGRELGLSSNAVYLAKSRVLRRVRQELGALLD
jgi:RNA polymerase sigma-70 factor, ECF subfamily